MRCVCIQSCVICIACSIAYMKLLTVFIHFLFFFYNNRTCGSWKKKSPSNVTELPPFHSVCVRRGFNCISTNCQTGLLITVQWMPAVLLCILMTEFKMMRANELLWALASFLQWQGLLLRVLQYKRWEGGGMSAFVEYSLQRRLSTRLSCNKTLYSVTVAK